MYEQHIETEAEVAVRHERGVCSPPPLTRRPADALPPLSLPQRALLTWLERYGYDRPVFNLFLALRVLGPLDAAALGRSLNEVVRRHEALRTTFPVCEGAERRPAVQEAGHSALPLTDLSGVTEAERVAEALRLAQAQVRHLFDVGGEVLLRAELLRLGEQEHYLTITTHHLISDGWSLNILLRDICLLYEAFAGEGRTWLARRRGAASARMRSPAMLPPEPAIQYGDFAYWQQTWPKEFVEGQLSYWRRKLQGYSSLPLPDGTRPVKEPSLSGAHQTFNITERLYGQLKELSRREGATLFMTLLSAFYVLLYSYTGQEDLVVDTPVANRNRVETEGVVGFFANSLFLRADLSANPTFRELLAKTRKVTLEAFDHQDVHFSQVMAATDIERFQVMFAVEGRRGALLRRLKGLSLESLPIEAGETLRPNLTVRDLSVRLWEYADRLRGRVSYRTDLFDAATITRMLREFDSILEAVLTNPEQRVSELARLR